jgi:hypothetical protein
VNLDAVALFERKAPSDRDEQINLALTGEAISDEVADTLIEPADSISVTPEIARNPHPWNTT